MEQEQKYYDLIVKVNNHENIHLSDDSSNSDDSVVVKDELDTTDHRQRPLQPIIETTDDEPSKEMDAL